MAPSVIDRTGISSLRSDTARRVLITLAYANAGLREAGRIRRNPGKPRGSIRHAWQSGFTTAEAIRLVAESQGFTPRIRQKAEAVFRAVYTERYIRRHDLNIVQFGEGFPLDEIDNEEHDTREIVRAMNEAIKRLEHHLYMKGY